MKNLFKIIMLSLLVVSCGDFEPILYDNVNGQTGIGFSVTSTSLVVPQEGITVTVPVRSTTLSTSDRSFNVSVDEAASTGTSADYTLGTVTIPANSYEGNFEVTFDNFDNLVDLITNVLVVKLDLPEGDAVVGSETVKYEYIKYLVCNDLSLVITTDNWGSETTWDIKDASGAVVQSGGPFADGAPGTVHNFDFTLPDGCYTFTIYDAFGDGLSDGTNTGTYDLTCSIITHVSGSGNFGASDSTEFCVNP